MKKHMQKTGDVAILIACSMIIGSFIAFAALNSGGRIQDAAFFYWQRYFVDNVVAMATLPGVWLFFIGSLMRYLSDSGTKTLLLLIVSLLIVINSQYFIIPVSHEASAIAFQSGNLPNVSETFLALKGLEDKRGAINGLLLLGYLLIYIFCPTKRSAE
jgi:membrane-associated phospholipid phosphatase